MAQTRKPLVPARQHTAADTIEAVRNATGGWDAEAFHVMERRDEALIRDEILNGPGSSAFVYNFKIQSTAVTGVSVVGARHLAAHFGGLRHRIVASTQKSGDMFTFTSFPSDNMSMNVSCAIVSELAEEPDFYSVVAEMTDIKSGNSIQMERRENRFELTRAGGLYERPNYQTIAQSKVYRNLVLALVPQDIVIRWKLDMLSLKKEEIITDSVIDEKRAAVLRFAAAHGLALDRAAVEALTMDQISGLSDAARDSVPVFVNACKGLGLELVAAAQQQEGEVKQVTQSTERPMDTTVPTGSPAAGGNQEVGASQGREANQEGRASPAAGANQEIGASQATRENQPQGAAGRTPATAGTAAADTLRDGDKLFEE